MGGAGPEPKASDEVRPDQVRDLEKNIQHTTRLRGDTLDAKECRKAEDKASKGGLRNVAKVVADMPGHAKLGSILWPLFDAALKKDNDLENMILEMISGTCGDDRIASLEGELEAKLAPIRTSLGSVLGSSTGQTSTEACSTSIRADLL